MIKRRLQKWLGINSMYDKFEDDIVDLYSKQTSKLTTKDLREINGQLERDQTNITILTRQIKEYNKDCVGIISKYEELHKRFKAGVDIGNRGAWAVLCFSDEKGNNITRFYKLSSGSEVKKFIEDNKYTNPHIDTPSGFNFRL